MNITITTGLYDEIRDELINAANAYADALEDPNAATRNAARLRFEAAQAAHSAWLDAEARELAAAQLVERWRAVIGGQG